MAPRIRFPSQGSRFGRIGLGLLLLTALPVGASIVRDASEERLRRHGAAAIATAPSDEALRDLFARVLRHGMPYDDAIEALAPFGVFCAPASAHPGAVAVHRECVGRIDREGRPRSLVLSLRDSAGVVVQAAVGTGRPLLETQADGSIGVNGTPLNPGDDGAARLLGDTLVMRTIALR